MKQQHMLLQLLRSTGFISLIRNAPSDFYDGEGGCGGVVIFHLCEKWSNNTDSYNFEDWLVFISVLYVCVNMMEIVKQQSKHVLVLKHLFQIFAQHMDFVKAWSTVVLMIRRKMCTYLYIYISYFSSSWFGFVVWLY